MINLVKFSEYLFREARYSCIFGTIQKSGHESGAWLLESCAKRLNNTVVVVAVFFCFVNRC